MKIDRRRVLALLGVGAAAPAGSAAAAGQVAFRHGVASGDPQQDRVILWTRITPPQGATGQVAYTWKLNPIDRRAGGAKSGAGVTSAARDYTVKVDVTGLDAGRGYTFEFESGGVTSPMGRTRTLPAGPTPDVVLAVASCSLFPNGYFNAYKAIAEAPRVDAVLHLGDYIYEYGGPGAYGMDSAVAAERPHDPFHEIQSLEDYRRRHAQYKADADLQAAHARAPWIVVWDDHETANDSWKGGAENHDPKTEGDWNARKARAIKAYYEWMPIREPKGGGFAINRSFHFGDLASLFMLETRLTARDHQLDYGRDLNGPDGKPDVAAFTARLQDPGRRMMGDVQQAWLGQELAASVKAGRPWQVLGNEVVMANILTPSPRKAMGEEAFAKASAELPAAVKTALARADAASALNLPFGLDMWDGYPAERERLYGLIRKSGAHVVVVSGDSHAFWANELSDAAGARVGAEFGTCGITSPGADDHLGGLALGPAFVQRNRAVRFCDQSAKGFVLLTLTPAEAKAELVAVSSIVSRSFETKVLKTFRVTPDGPGQVSALSEV